MKAVVQRVKKASVVIDGKPFSKIKKGLVVLLAVARNDKAEDVDILARKLVYLRIMADKNNKMNLSILDTKTSLMVISQFTLYGDTSKGRRPSFIHAADHLQAKHLYNLFVKKLNELGVRRVTTGKFGAYMEIMLENDGPVTIIMDSKTLLKNE